MPSHNSRPCPLAFSEMIKRAALRRDAKGERERARERQEREAQEALEARVNAGRDAGRRLVSTTSASASRVGRRGLAGSGGPGSGSGSGAGSGAGSAMGTVAGADAESSWREPLSRGTHRQRRRRLPAVQAIRGAGGRRRPNNTSVWAVDLLKHVPMPEAFHFRQPGARILVCGR